MTINVHKNKQRSCKHLKSCRKKLWILNTLPFGVGLAHEAMFRHKCFCFLHITYDKPYFFLQPVEYTQ